MNQQQANEPEAEEKEPGQVEYYVRDATEAEKESIESQLGDAAKGIGGTWQIVDTRSK